MSVVFIGIDHRGIGDANLHMAVQPEVGEMLIKTEMIVGGVSLKISGQSVPATHRPADDITWDDLNYAVKRCTELIRNARQMAIDKRLEAIL